MNLYYEIELPTDSDVAALADALNELSFVELAYPRSVPAEPSSNGVPNTPDFAFRQRHRSRSFGIGDEAVGGVPGIEGAGTTIVDVEFGWVLDHEDLSLPPSTNINPQTGFSLRDHGAAVLGILGARVNGYGVTGIVPDATLLVSPGFHFSGAINLAASRLGPGDVILLEIALDACGTDSAPLETDQAAFDAISTATGLGIAVVEAAGNGYANLDSPECGGLFDRNIRDSGAIMVGAGDHETFSRLPNSNFGSRVDVQAWGSGIMTTGYGHLFDGGNVRERYTHLFGGTSGASAIVAGAVLALQGAAIAHGLDPLTPAEVRQLLVETGRPQDPNDPPEEHIGPIPFLPAAVSSLLGMSLDLCGATDLGAAPEVTIDGTTSSRVDDDAGSCGSRAADRTYTYTAPSAGTYFVDTCGSPLDTVLYVRDGDCTGPEIACNDDACGKQSLASVSLTAGQQISIVVDGPDADAASGEFGLRISQNACGNGVLDAGEGCDDGNNQDGDCCSSLCEVEVIGSACDDGDPCSVGDTCDSAGKCVSGTEPLDCNDSNPCTFDLCVPGSGCSNPRGAGQCEDGNNEDGDCCSSSCTYEPLGSPCDDADPCTLADACNGAGRCRSSQSLDCEDSDACTRDSCVRGSGCVHQIGAAAKCKSDWHRGSFSSKGVTGQERLSIQLTQGPALHQTSFGDPLSTGGTAVTFCVYDDAGAEVARVGVDRAGATCGKKDCWRALGEDPPDGKGYSYRDGELSSDGVQSLKMKADAPGRSQILLVAKNHPKKPLASLPAGISAALQNSSSVTVQVMTSDGPQCFEKKFDEVKRSNALAFEAK